MRIWKVAQVGGEDSKNVAKLLKFIFNALSNDFGVPAKWDRQYLFDASIEKHDPSDPLGESWISVSSSRFRIATAPLRAVIVMDKYYENEFVNDDHAKNAEVVVTVDDPQGSLDKVREALSRISA